MGLAAEQCVPCHGGVPPLEEEEARALHRDIPKWKLERDAIQREFVFDDFPQAIRFIDLIATIAEEQGHHPDIHNYYNKVLLVLTTHAVKGLTKNDFIVAAKIDDGFAGLNSSS